MCDEGVSATDEVRQDGSTKGRCKVNCNPTGAGKETQEAAVCCCLDDGPLPMKEEERAEQVAQGAEDFRDVHMLEYV